ncbi:type IV secretion system protein VirB7 [uncultured Aliivibrio sp.]|nr:type IV secretion system protein VirB7 [uncultured Aliivibrio sp.]
MTKFIFMCLGALLLSGCSSSTPNAQPSYERATIEVINGTD